MYKGVPTSAPPPPSVVNGSRSAPARNLAIPKSSTLATSTRTLCDQADVFRLQIPVNELLPVSGLDSRGHVADELQRPQRIEAPLRPQRFAKGASVQQLHHQKRVRASHAEVVDRHDVGVRKGGGDPGFLLKALDRTRQPDEIHADDLGGDAPIERAVEGGVHGAHAATAQAALELIPSAEQARNGDGNQRRTVRRAAPRARFVAAATGRTLLEPLARGIRPFDRSS